MGHWKIRSAVWLFKVLLEKAPDRVNYRIGKSHRRQQLLLSTQLRRRSATIQMDRKTRASFTQCCFSKSGSDRQRARDNYRGQNNAAEHNDQRHRRINKGHYGQCHCRAVRPFCLPRDICSGTDASGPHARYALAFKARTIRRATRNSAVEESPNAV